MSEYIIRFNEEYRFLSNFWKCDVEFEGKTYASTEHAYQAAKTTDESERETIRNSNSCGEVKKLGRKVTLRNDWEQVKDGIMTELLMIKFSVHKDLEQKLLATGDKILVEGNYWHDNTWGVCYCDKCNGQGKNKLGELLMQVRAKRKITGELEILKQIINEINLKDRTHEECAECAKENIQPQPCKGHVDGPSPCSEFKAKDNNEIDLEKLI